jgi:succinate dehydrogenase/fumarate reductase-like Fe-S protein
VQVDRDTSKLSRVAPLPHMFVVKDLVRAAARTAGALAAHGVSRCPAALLPFSSLHLKILQCCLPGDVHSLWLPLLVPQVVDMSNFYAQYKHIQPYLQTTKPKP